MFDALEFRSREPKLVADQSVAPAVSEAQCVAPCGMDPFKRGLDIVISLVALLCLLPVFLAIAVAIKLDSQGPVFYRQWRSGLGGSRFQILKFRSMTHQVARQSPTDAVKQARINDPRVTRFGRFLRAKSLDELPQLINILKGDMSLVGPRPHALSHDVLFASLEDRYSERFATRPGLTGLAQVRGYRGEIIVMEQLSRRIDLDLDYIQGWSLKRDLWLLLMTLPVVLGHKNAY